MAIGGIVELFFGVNAEGKTLEELAQPLTSEDAEEGNDENDDVSDDDKQPNGDAASQTVAREAARQRIRARGERHQSATTKANRFRPGPGRAVYSPCMSTSSRSVPEETLDQEIQTLANVVKERGNLTSRGLYEAAGARYWGPGRFHAALREALAEGQVVRRGESRFGPPTDGADKFGPRP